MSHTFLVRIFDTRGSKLSEVSEDLFLLENDMQKLTETNLQQIFDLDLVRSEFELQGLRIDTLAFDRDSKGFVIIEYKGE
jgi:hypothetical protein